MIGIIRIATAFVLNEGEETARSSTRRRDIATNEATIAANPLLAPSQLEGRGYIMMLREGQDAGSWIRGRSGLRGDN